MFLQEFHLRFLLHDHCLIFLFSFYNFSKESTSSIASTEVRDPTTSAKFSQSAALPQVTVNSVQCLQPSRCLAVVSPESAKHSSVQHPQSAIIATNAPTITNPKLITCSPTIMCQQSAMSTLAIRPQLATSTIPLQSTTPTSVVISPQSTISTPVAIYSPSQENVPEMAFDQPLTPCSTTVPTDRVSIS